jgi:hypothetical protein
MASKFSKITLAEEITMIPKKQGTSKIYLERPPEHLIVEEDRKPTVTKKRGCTAGSTDPKKKKCVHTGNLRNQVASCHSQRMIRNRRSDQSEVVRNCVFATSATSGTRLLKFPPFHIPLLLDDDVSRRRPKLLCAGFTRMN